MGTVYNASMPELPEVQSIRQSLEKHLIGRVITRVVCRRRDVVHGPACPKDLLSGQRVIAMHRHGKQLALLSEQRALVVQLGMSGSLRLVVDPSSAPLKHDHVIWHLDDAARLHFHDPRRFGGLSPMADHACLTQRWKKLGPDALACKVSHLQVKLARTGRSIKACLLDQQIVAGLGNIYVDELLYNCHIHPQTPGSQLSRQELARMIRAMRRILKSAIEAGGSTIRDYVNGVNQPGKYQQGHQVYGRGGHPCRNCGQQLGQSLIGGRATVFCPQCQPLVEKAT